MITQESGLAAGLGVRPLRRDDARGVALLVADYFTELGTRGGMSVEQTEQLFATPWLEGGAGFVLERGSEIAGYGFARPSQWKGSDTVQFGLTLKRGYRAREVHRILTDPLLAAAMAIAERRGINNISIHLRSTDTAHPPVMLELGFREHEVSMLGFRHDLKDIPNRPLPQGLRFRPARLPAESSALVTLLAAVFDDRDRQGEPLADSYLDFVLGKSGFEPEQVQIVELGSKPVGCIVADATDNGPGNDYSIIELAVLAGYRRQGIGSALVCRELRWFEARGAGAALTGMFSSNIAATMFWRLGFRPDPRRTFRFFIRDTAATLPANDGGHDHAIS